MSRYDFRSLANSGFSLIEVMVVMGVSTIIALGFGNLIVTGLTSQKTVEGRSDITNTVSELRTLLQDGPTCLANFTGQNPVSPGFVPVQLTTSGGAAVYTSGQNVPGSNAIQIQSMKVDSFAADNAAVNPYVGKSTFTVVFNKLGNQYAGQTSTKTIKVATTTNSSFAITECRALPGMTDGLWTLAADLQTIYYNTGNVGIGTAAPAKTLDVNGAIRGSAHFISNNPGGALVLNAGPPSAGAYSGIILRSDNTVGDESVYKDLMFVSSNGNVGIGTNNPKTTLDVNGISTFRTYMNIYDSNNIGQWFAGSIANPAGPGRYLYGLWDEGASQGIIGTGGAFPLEFYVASGEVMRIHSNGYVGIGTTTPTAKLDVYNAWITPQDNVITDTAATAGITWYTPAPTAYGIFRTAGGWNAPNYQQLDMSFSTGIIIDGGSLYGKSGTFLQPNGGNVAVGSTTPRAKLDVWGGQFMVTGSGLNGTIMMDTVGGTSLIGTNAPSNGISIAPNGFVGVATTSPAARLDVVSPDNNPATPIAKFEANNQSQGISMYWDGIGQFAATQLTFKVGGNEYMRVNTGGNVGIGTNNPQSLLDVNGNINVQTVTYMSDQRLKKDITPVESPLDKLLTLNPVTYYWNEVAKARGMKDESQHMGLIAQDVEKVFPQAVHTAPDGFKSVEYASLIAPAIGAIQELKAENVELKAENVELKNENLALEKRLQHIEAALLNLNSKK
jgi:prepilin-type N-terminal cleavage/methylation domain-containing protein